MIKKRRTKVIYNLIPIFIVISFLFSPTKTTFGAPGVASENLSIAPGITTCLNFSDLVPGQSVEGLGAVHPLLNISSTGNAVAVFEGDASAAAFGAPNPSSGVGDSIINNGLGVNGGFVDAMRLHEYSFSFADGVTVDNFSVKMYDFGDFNPFHATEHKVELVGYGDNNAVVDSDALEFTSDTGGNPTSGSAGDLQSTGDAVTALPQEPGNFTFRVNGSGITRLELQFSHNNAAGFQASDPNIGLAVLCFQTEGEINTNLCVDFQAVAPGTSVEGLGAMHPDLDIETSGNAVAIHQADSTAAGYGAPNPSAGLGASILNNGVGDLGGFVDLDRIHDYQFSFSPGVSVDFFAVKMLDFGDYNPTRATEHTVALVAYNAANEVVSFNELNFTSNAAGTPTSGSAGNLQLTGDAVTAIPQEPGNFTFTVSGTGITRLEMQFSNNVSTGHKASDPNIGMAVLCFVPETNDVPEIPTDSTCIDFAALPPGTSVEGLDVLYPNLNVSSSGNAVAIQEGDATAAGYGAPNPSAGAGAPILNNGVGPLGGFVDLDRIHDYEFSFADGLSVSFFAVKMLDFGDYNPVKATQHNVSLVSYNANNDLVDISQLAFTSDNSATPSSGSAGNLQFSGDAITAQPQEPGNYIFAVEGAGITHLTMNFLNNAVAGHSASDPNLAMAVLCFVPETPPPPPPPTGTPLTCEDIGRQTVAEDNWDERIIDGLAPASLSFARPDNADYAIINTGWEWTGDPNQAQVTEIHSVETPFGTVTSGDYGNEELAGQVLWYDVLQGAYAQPTLPVTVGYAGDGSDPGSHRSHGLISWCGIPGDPPPPPPPPPALDPPTAVLTLIEPKPAPQVGGKFLVEYACSQSAPNLVSATVNGYDLINGQQVRLIVGDDVEVRYWQGQLLFLYAPEFSFDVTCADGDGNEVSTQVVPEFQQP